jgi:hypothetical protein
MSMPALCPQPAGKRGAWGNPGNPNSTFPRVTTSEDPGADGVSPTVAFRDGMESGPLEDPKVKAARPDAPIDRGLASFAKLPPARGDTLMHVAPIEADVSIMLPHAGASGTVPSSQATLEASVMQSCSKMKALGALVGPMTGESLEPPKYFSCSRTIEFQA